MNNTLLNIYIEFVVVDGACVWCFFLFIVVFF